MLKQFNIDQLLEMFFKYPTTKMSMNEAARRIKLTTPTIASAAKHLIKQGLLHQERVGRSILLSANLDSERFVDLKRIHNIRSMLDIKDILIKEYNHPKAIIVYGSYAKGEDIENSDIDIAIISHNKKETDLNKFEATLNRKIHLMTFGDWKHIPKHLKINIINGIKLYGVIEC